MMRLRTSIAAFALISAISHAQTPVSFKRTYTEGMKETYLMSSDMNMRMAFMGEESSSNIKSTADAIFTYSKVQADGTATLDFLFTNGKSVTVSDPADEEDGEEKDDDIKGTAKIDPFGTQTEVKEEKKPSEEDEEGDPVVSALDSLTSGTGGTSFLPTKPVVPGDTWTIPLEPDSKDRLFEKDSVATGKFIGEKEYKGQLVWVVEATMSPKFELNEKDLREQGATPPSGDMEEVDITMEGTLVSKVVYFVRKSDKKVLLQTSDMKLDCTMNFVGLEMKLEMSGKFNLESKD